MYPRKWLKESMGMLSASIACSKEIPSFVDVEIHGDNKTCPGKSDQSQLLWIFLYLKQWPLNREDKQVHVSDWLPQSESYHLVSH